MATANVQENITQHKKTFFYIILIKIAKGNVQENITLHKKKQFFSIILIEISKGNVQENITQHIKTFFLHNFDLNRNNKCTRKYYTTQTNIFVHYFD